MTYAYVILSDTTFELQDDVISLLDFQQISYPLSSDGYKGSQLACWLHHISLLFSLKLSLSNQISLVIVGELLKHCRF